MLGPFLQEHRLDARFEKIKIERDVGRGCGKCMQSE
jgi:hypothetical protein